MEEQIATTVKITWCYHDCAKLSLKMRKNMNVHDSMATLNQGLIQFNRENNVYTWYAKI